MMPDAEEVERLVRAYAAPDEERGWAGNQQMLDNAEEIAAFIAENYQPTSRFRLPEWAVVCHACGADVGQPCDLFEGQEISHLQRLNTWKAAMESSVGPPTPVRTMLLDDALSQLAELKSILEAMKG